MSLDFATAFTRCPLVAILRGVRPELARVGRGDAPVEGAEVKGLQLKFGGFNTSFQAVGPTAHT